jgi:DNA helicase-2/ATP-dependent DNA helicase PcrA
VGGVPFFDRREVKDVLAYLRLTVNPSDDAAFQRAVRWPRRGVGDVTLDRLQDAARAAGESLLQAAARASTVDDIPTAGSRGLEDFAAGIARLAELQQTTQPLDVLEACARSFGLAAALEEEEDGADRLENVSELFATAASFDRTEVEEPDGGSDEASDLELYLQSVSLRSEIDDVDFDGEALTLMTLHNAKGLEFPIVFVAGLEEGLFPLSRAVESDAGLEEERRLFYVGVTRAMDRLYLTYADRRWRAGMESRSERSSFLEELPEEPIDRLVAGGFRSWRRGGRRGATAGSRAFESAGLGSDPVEDAGPNPWWRSAVYPEDAESRPPGSSGGPSGSDDLRYDYSDSQVPLELAPGVRVVHPRFGAGVILAVSGAGSGAKADIEFEDVGTKKVIVAYAGLRPA